MIQPNEVKIDKKILIGKTLKILGHRSDVGLKQKPMAWIHIAYQEQQPQLGLDAQGRKTMIGSDKFLDSLRAAGTLDGALVKLEEFVKPKRGFWFFRYTLLQPGKNTPEPEVANQPREPYRGRKDTRLLPGGIPQIDSNSR
jgi:hypothetical protein